MENLHERKFGKVKSVPFQAGEKKQRDELLGMRLSLKPRLGLMGCIGPSGSRLTWP
jgi:hypothetical protein